MPYNNSMYSGILTSDLDPTVSEGPFNDYGPFVKVGDFWLNTSTGATFFCKNATIGAQVWESFSTDIDTGRQSFTPEVAGSTVAGATTYTTQIGKYQKIGSRVFCDIQLVWSASTGLGNLLIRGLPFTANSDVNAICSVLTQSVTLPLGPLAMGVISGTQVELLAPINAAVAQNVAMAATGNLQLTLNYSV